MMTKCFWWDKKGLNTDPEKMINDFPFLGSTFDIYKWFTQIVGNCFYNLIKCHKKGVNGRIYGTIVPLMKKPHHFFVKETVFFLFSADKKTWFIHHFSPFRSVLSWRERTWFICHQEAQLPSLKFFFLKNTKE